MKQTFKLHRISLVSILPFLIILFSFITQSNSAIISTACHYSCQKCLQATYTQCITCKQPDLYFQLVNSYKRYNDGSETIRYGLCMGKIEISFNPMGIVLLLVLILMYFIKMKSKKNQLVILIISWFQTLGMLSFIPIPFIQPLSFIMQSFTPFMFITMVSKAYKTGQQSQMLLQNNWYRLQHFLKSQKVTTNTLILGPIVCIMVLYIVLIPLFVHLRKCLCGQDKCRRMSQKIIRRLQALFYIVYFFIIQQAYVILFIGLKYTQHVSAIVMLVIFVISNVFMMINYWIKPIKEFPNKKVLFVHCFEKILVPFMLIFGSQAYLVAVPILMILARILQGKFNDKDYNNKPAQKKKYYGYLAGVVNIAVCIGILIIVEKVIKSLPAMMGVSYLVVVMGILLFSVTFLVELLQLLYDMMKKDQSEEYNRNVLIRQQQTKTYFTNTTQSLEPIEITFTNEIAEQPNRRNSHQKKPKPNSTQEQIITQTQNQQSSKKLKQKRKKAKQNQEKPRQLIRQQNEIQTKNKQPKKKYRKQKLDPSLYNDKDVMCREDLRDNEMLNEIMESFKQKDFNKQQQVQKVETNEIEITPTKLLEEHVESRQQDISDEKQSIDHKKMKKHKKSGIRSQKRNLHEQEVSASWNQNQIGYQIRQIQINNSQKIEVSSKCEQSEEPICQFSQIQPVSEFHDEIIEQGNS